MIYRITRDKAMELCKKLHPSIITEESSNTVLAAALFGSLKNKKAEVIIVDKEKKDSNDSCI